MALDTRIVFVILHTIMWSLLSICINGGASDIYCLQSIKDSLEDPFNHLSSWNFKNNTKCFFCDFVGVDCWNNEDGRVFKTNLSHMGLKGQFPRGFEHCTSLQSIDLSFNQLSGTIPSDISRRLPYITSLDLSNNNFSGEIPTDIANCYYLNVLRLDKNQFTSKIPQQLGQLPRIHAFNVSNNMLSGKVPLFFKSSFAGNNYANNRGLCGGPLESCKEHDERPHQSFRDGFVVGYVVFATSVILVYMTYYVPWRQVKIRVRNFIIYSIREKKNKKDSIQVGNFPLLEPTEVEFKQISTLERSISRISFHELCKATDNFSIQNVIGAGNKGTMYRATLPNGWFLAVKRLRDSELFEKEFLSEIRSLERFRHSSLVPLIGYCTEEKERILVYKFMSNGNLSDWLHSVEGKGRTLEWPVRLKIALGVARGLAWLHNYCSLLIVHLNMSSECILLDQHFEPKISNLGGAKFMYRTAGDLNRSFLVNSRYWELDFVKKDVYDFGTVLFELITGKKFSQTTNSENGFDSYSGLHVAIDENLMGKGFDGEIFHLLRVACKCVQQFPYERPTMLEVYDTISTIWEAYGPGDDSEVSASAATQQRLLVTLFPR
ncbi:Receptor-like kinase [Quillaja saponaria]|uniref:Receptor-like kinase n=1 Tax=Quillaja saponaria TaxID=32244 RepID=A0AAD7VM58_QUISA|nr:Receptor-like kinase [Quillaja saponaria]